MLPPGNSFLVACPTSPDLAGSYGETGKAPFREAIRQSSSLKASSSEDLDRLGSEHAIASAAVGHHFPIARQIPQSMTESRERH